MQYDFYEVVKAVVKKVSMVNPKPSNLCHDKVYSSNQEAGFEDTINGWVDVLNLVSDIRSIRKKQVIGYKALGYDNWEIAEKLHITEDGVNWHIRRIKNILGNNYSKSAAKTLYNIEGENHVA